MTQLPDTITRTQFRAFRHTLIEVLGGKHSRINLDRNKHQVRGIRLSDNHLTIAYDYKAMVVDFLDLDAGYQLQHTEVDKAQVLAVLEPIQHIKEVIALVKTFDNRAAKTLHLGFGQNETEPYLHIDATLQRINPQLARTLRAYGGLDQREVLQRDFIGLKAELYNASRRRQGPQH